MEPFRSRWLFLWSPVYSCLPWCLFLVFLYCFTSFSISTSWAFYYYYFIYFCVNSKCTPAFLGFLCWVSTLMPVSASMHLTTKLQPPVPSFLLYLLWVAYLHPGFTYSACDNSSQFNIFPLTFLFSITHTRPPDKISTWRSNGPLKIIFTIRARSSFFLLFASSVSIHSSHSFSYSGTDVGSIVNSPFAYSHIWLEALLIPPCWYLVLHVKLYLKYEPLQFMYMVTILVQARRTYWNSPHFFNYSFLYIMNFPELFMQICFTASLYSPDWPGFAI